MNAPIRAKSNLLPFYSKLIGWLESNPQKVASPQQWQGSLNNLQNVRQEEIQCAELVDFNHYYEPNDRIRKEDLISEATRNLAKCRPTIQSHWRQAYRPSLDVKTIHDTLPKNIEARAKPFVEKAQTFYQHPSLGYWIIRTGYQDLMTDAPNWIILDPQGKLVLTHEKHRGWFPTAVEAFDEMHRVIRNRFEPFGKENPSTLYDQYTFLGGNNYQEWFVRLPDWPLPYSDNHFGLDHLLIHIRTTERVDYDGRPLLMVEEIQSPWHADIRSYGSYSNEAALEDDEYLIAEAPFAKEWHELALKAVIWLAVQQGHNHIGLTTGKQQCERWRDLAGLMNLYDNDIPKVLKKIADQYDCANDWATIITRRPDGSIYSDKQDEWVVKNKSGTPLTAPLKNKDVALYLLNERSTPVKEQIRLLQVSPTLKRAVSAGRVPLFGW